MTINEYGPWNPGVLSQLPPEYLPLSTIFRQENTTTSIKTARELSDFSGLPAQDLVAFRTERLIVHELLIRVMADLAVPDGTNYEDLGINFRAIATTILTNYVTPNFEAIRRGHDALRDAALEWITGELDREVYDEKSSTGVIVESSRGSLFYGLFSSRDKTIEVRESPEQRQARVLARWQSGSTVASSSLEKACLAALFRIGTGIANRHGRFIGGQELITTLAANLVCNDYGSDLIGEAITPYIREASIAEGFQFLPRQNNPLVMNVKGASAAGKSTLRPLQRALADRLNVPWCDFSLISPDIWRKFLLDYESLGAAYKYAGAMTGLELEMVDRKLDRYIAKRAENGAIPHLLIDRFRFDSFVPEADADETSRLLTRFGDLVYMYFVITPPDMTVERAWTRGQKVGRYKAVDDLLYHNVEAYEGMPELFFTWALSKTKRVHYEFLDNSVAEQSRPRTVAFGWNGEMNILDVKCMINMDRYKKLNINADNATSVYIIDEMPAERNVDFLKRCAALIPIVNFVDQATGRVFGRVENGQWCWRDEERIAVVQKDPDVKAGLEAIGSCDCHAVSVAQERPFELDRGKAHTLGAWGEAA